MNCLPTNLVLSWMLPSSTYFTEHSPSYLENLGTLLESCFLFFSAFNTIQPEHLRNRLENTGVDALLSHWILNLHIYCPQYMRIQDCVSDMVVYSIGVFQVTISAHFLFSMYTADYVEFTELFPTEVLWWLCYHLPHFRGGWQGEQSTKPQLCYLVPVKPPLNQCREEPVVDFCRNIHPPPTLVNIQETDIKKMDSYKYLSVHNNIRLDWSDNNTALFRKGQSRLYLLRRI